MFIGNWGGGAVESKLLNQWTNRSISLLKNMSDKIKQAYPKQWEKKKKLTNGSNTYVNEEVLG